MIVFTSHFIVLLYDIYYWRVLIALAVLTDAPFSLHISLPCINTIEHLWLICIKPKWGTPSCFCRSHQREHPCQCSVYSRLYFLNWWSTYSRRWGCGWVASGHAHRAELWDTVGWMWRTLRNKVTCAGLGSDVWDKCTFGGLYLLLILVVLGLWVNKSFLKNEIKFDWDCETGNHDDHTALEFGVFQMLPLLVN